MNLYAERLVKDAYIMAGSPSDEDEFTRLFVTAFKDVSITNFVAAYFIYLCWNYDELAKEILSAEGKENSPEVLKRKMTEIRKQASRAKEEILQFIQKFSKGD